MSKSLKLTTNWQAKSGLMQPGEYRIPGEISLAFAKCAVADGAGEIVEAPSFRQRGRPKGSGRKGAAPENKAGGPAPDNKASMAGADGSSGGDGAESQRDASASVPGAADSSGE